MQLILGKGDHMEANYDILTHMETSTRVVLNTWFGRVNIRIGAWAVLGSEGMLNFPGPAWFSAATLKM